MIVAFGLVLGMVGAPRAQASLADLVRGHSHNDYNQRHPLHDALDLGFYSVEADIWLHRGKVQVSHGGWFFKGTLEELYLKPLQKIVDRQGSVQGDGREFILWLDLKDGSRELRLALHELLGRYPMLTTFVDGHKTVRGPVTVVLTGDEKSKTRFVEEFPVRRATRDSNDFDPKDGPADSRWSWYALKWSHVIHWKGGTPPPGVLQRLREVTAAVHAKGRKLRFWGLPAREEVWKAAFDAGVDQLSADDLPRMHRFLEQSVLD